MENSELSQKNSQNEKELQELHERLAEMLCPEEEEPGPGASEEWKQRESHLKEELEQCRAQVRRRAALQPKGEEIPQNKAMLVLNSLHIQS